MSEDRMDNNSAPHVTASREELEYRLAALDTFGREEVIEQVLAFLQLAVPQPCTIVIAAEPGAGKSHLLTALTRLFSAQRLPVAEVVCRPYEHSMPCALLGAVIHQLLIADAAGDAVPRAAPLLSRHPWLAGLFPMLGEREASPPPVDLAERRRVLETLLLEITSATTRIALVHNLHLADDASLAAFAAVQALPEHGLRLIAGADLEEEMLPACINGLLAANARTLLLPPLSPEQVRHFLQDALPEIARPEVADALHEATAGSPLAIETRLRGWVKTGALVYRDDCWEFDPEKPDAGTAVQDDLPDCRPLVASPFPPILVAPQARVVGGVESWDIPPASPVTMDEVDAIITAVLAIRLAGVQFRLYPSSSEMVRSAVREAIVELRRLFVNRPSLIVTFDGRTVAFDGQIIQRRDLQVAMKDFHRWMTEGNIRAIGITAQVREYELARFLHALATFEPRDARVSLLDTVVLLNLAHIKLLTRSYQPDLVQAHLPQVPVSSEDATPAVACGEDVVTKRTVGTSPVTDDETMPSLLDPYLLDDAAWARLSRLMPAAPPATRCRVMEHLLRWLVDEENTPERALSWKIDRLLHERLHDEENSEVLQETLVAIAARLQQCVAAGDWEGLFSMLEPLYARLRETSSTEVQRQLTIVLDRAGESMVLPGLLEQQAENPLELERARPVVRLLGERVLRPIIAALKSANAMQERSRLMQLLREFGREQPALLIEELHASNPWYVHRNLLQVLAEVGGEEGLDVIGARMTHEDPRVRMEAVVAAARIAREHAVPYLIQGLEDPNPAVRARAASLISLCPAPRLLEMLLRLLHPRLGKEEPDSVQLNACLGLGFFPQEIARMVLVQIVHPSLFSPYRKKSDSVRSAAATALAQHLPHQAAMTTLEHAGADRSPLVRQTARRVLAEWQSRQNTEQTA